MTSTILRHGSRRRFLMVAREAVNDDRLSFRARGILAWLLDKPDDWAWSSTALAGAGAEGREAIRAALRELEACGYLHRAKHQGTDGKWRTVTVVYERPEDAAEESPAPRNPSSVPAPRKPDVGSSGANPLTDTETETQTLAPAAPKKATQPRTPDPLFEAVCSVTGTNWTELTKTGRGPVNTAVADLRALGVTPGQVTVRARKYAMTYPNAKLTPMALAKHWAELGNGAAPAGSVRTLEEDRAEMARLMAEEATR